MSINDFNRVKQRLDTVFASADSTKDPEIKSHLAVLSCILCSGLIEAFARHYISEYARRRSDPAVHRFVVAKLRRGTQNLKTDELLELICTFDKDLGNSIASNISDEARDAIDSVVDRRNKLAHGNLAGIGIETMSRYYKSIDSALDTAAKRLAT